MSAHSAERRLVKSSPELWAEVSDQESLGRRLHAFGEIRITGTDPETTVAWEGDEVSGTVAIASAGWGTKVTLTVEVDDPPAATPDPPAPAPEVIAALEPEPTAALEPEPAAALEPEPTAAPEPEPADAPPAKPAKQGFFARLFDFGPAIPDPPRQVEASDEPEPEPEPEPEAAPEAVPEPMPDPIVVPEVEPEVSTEAPEPAPMSAESIVEILSGVLDDLGAAHHRPFSRS